MTASESETAAAGESRDGQMNRAPVAYAGSGDHVKGIAGDLETAYPPRQPFLPQVFPTRQSLLRALKTAAEFCRHTPQMSRQLKISLMRSAFDVAESRLRNRLLAKKQAWVRAGMPQPYPWILLEAGR